MDARCWARIRTAGEGSSEWNMQAKYVPPRRVSMWDPWARRVPPVPQSYPQDLWACCNKKTTPAQHSVKADVLRDPLAFAARLLSVELHPILALLMTSLCFLASPHTHNRSSPNPATPSPLPHPQSQPHPLQTCLSVCLWLRSQPQPPSLASQDNPILHFSIERIWNLKPPHRSFISFSRTLGAYARRPCCMRRSFP